MRERLNPIKWTRFGMAVWVGCALLSGCSNEPAGPGNPPDHNYSVYFRDANSNGYYYEYCPATDSIVDSFKIPYPVYWGFQVSADGSEIYGRALNGVGIIDRSTMTVVGELAYSPGDIAFSSDTRYVAIQGEELNILHREACNG